MYQTQLPILLEPNSIVGVVRAHSIQQVSHRVPHGRWGWIYCGALFLPTPPSRSHPLGHSDCSSQQRISPTGVWDQARLLGGTTPLEGARTSLRQCTLSRGRVVWRMGKGVGGNRRIVPRNDGYGFKFQSDLDTKRRYPRLGRC